MNPIPLDEAELFAHKCKVSDMQWDYFFGYAQSLLGYQEDKAAKIILDALYDKVKKDERAKTK
jgi:hypothetical protein